MTRLWTPKEHPLIIGQAPARGNDGKFPFAGQSGARLARLAGVGVSGDDLPEHFDLKNLLAKYPGKKSNKGDLFDMGRAKKSAGRIRRHQQIYFGPRYILLMGRKVQKAFGFSIMEFLKPRGDLLRSRGNGINDWHRVIVFPHPSGVSHWWNNTDNREAAKWVLRKVLRDSPKRPR